jgi:hypothetical protein
MPGGSEEWFLWYIRWDLLVVALLYWRQLHLRRIGQWRNMHKGFISEISTLYGMTSMNEESVFDMAREDFTPEEILTAVVRVQCVIRAHQGKSNYSISPSLSLLLSLSLSYPVLLGRRWGQGLRDAITPVECDICGQHAANVGGMKALVVYFHRSIAPRA